MNYVCACILYKLYDDLKRLSSKTNLISHLFKIEIFIVLKVHFLLIKAVFRTFLYAFQLKSYESPNTCEGNT